MEYKCNVCGFIHYGELHDGYYCPLCRSGKHEFKKINETEENKLSIKQTPEETLTSKYKYKEVEKVLSDESKMVIAITDSPIRVSIGDYFEYEYGEYLEGKLNAALKKIGFDYVFDGAFGSDLVSMEEASELKRRVDNNENLPLITSWCPNEKKELFENLSNNKNDISFVKSPIEALSTVVKNIMNKELNKRPEDIVIISISSCNDIDYEEVDINTDYSLSAFELSHLIKEKEIDFKNLKNQNFDNIYASSSGILSGTSGGVTTSLLRTYYFLETGNDLDSSMVYTKKHNDFIEHRLKVGNKVIKAASIYKTTNLNSIGINLNEFDLIEFNNCEMQLANNYSSKNKEILNARKKSLLNKDNRSTLKYAYKNPNIISIYEEYLEKPLSSKSKELLYIKK